MGLFCHLHMFRHFRILGGIAFTAITYSADAQAMDSYTLLTVAAVVLGGGDLNGGRVNHLGAVFGAVTLSLVTILLGFLHVNTDFTAAVQGLLLIIILSLRLLKKGAEEMKSKVSIKDIHWIFAVVGSLLMWIVIGIISGNLNLNSLTANMTSAAFSWDRCTWSDDGYYHRERGD